MRRWTLAIVRRFEVVAPAKVNLSLHVLGRRADGFHDIASLFAPISIADRVRVDTGGRNFSVRVPGSPELEGEGNLALRAARAFERATGLAGAVRVHIRKEIPVAAGLGGGSTDAAAVLRALCRHHGLSPGDERVRAAALEVGSDVPFFLDPRPAVARGRGEILSPAPPLPALWLVVVKPPFGVSAGAAYGELARGRAEGRYPRGRDPGELPPLRTARSVAGILHNDLQAPVAALEPIEDLAGRLRSAGIQWTLMSGSGSCVFGVLASAAEARKCARRLELREGEGVFLARTLKRGAGVRETDPHAAE